MFFETRGPFRFTGRSVPLICHVKGHRGYFCTFYTQVRQLHHLWGFALVIRGCVVRAREIKGGLCPFFRFSNCLNARSL